MLVERLFIRYENRFIRNGESSCNSKVKRSIFHRANVLSFSSMFIARNDVNSDANMARPSHVSTFTYN